MFLEPAQLPWSPGYHLMQKPRLPFLEVFMGPIRDGRYGSATV